MKAPAPARLMLVAALFSPVLARAQDASAPPAGDQNASPSVATSAAPAAAPETIAKGKDKPEDRGVVLIAPSDEGDLTNHDATDAAVAVANARDVTSRRVTADSPNVYVVVENNQTYVYGPQDDGGYAARQALAQANLTAAVASAFYVGSTQRVYNRMVDLAPRRAFYRSSGQVFRRGGARYFGSGFQRFGGSSGTRTHIQRWPQR